MTTPGICPLSDSSLKQILHTPNLLRYARDLPQRLHRVYARTLNFGVLFVFAIHDFFATLPPSAYWFLNGMFMNLRSLKPCSSFFAVVTMVMSIPKTWATLS